MKHKRMIDKLEANRVEERNEETNLDGTTKHGGWIWEQNKSKSCEKCDKVTDELYCTPIGSCNWRCRECQISLREAIPGCKEMEENGASYTSIPIKPPGYEDPPIHKRYPDLYRQKSNGKYVKKKKGWFW